MAMWDRSSYKFCCCAKFDR